MRRAAALTMTFTLELAPVLRIAPLQLNVIHI